MELEMGLGLGLGLRLGVAVACGEVLCLGPETVGSSIYLPLHYCAHKVSNEQGPRTKREGQQCQLLANCSPRWQL